MHSNHSKHAERSRLLCTKQELWQCQNKTPCWAGPSGCTANTQPSKQQKQQRQQRQLNTAAAAAAVKSTRAGNPHLKINADECNWALCCLWLATLGHTCEAHLLGALAICVDLSLALFGQHCALLSSKRASQASTWPHMQRCHLPDSVSSEC